jgi:hypothetical protein
VNFVPEDWIPRLASAIAASLREFGPRQLRGQPIVALDFGCFPWHGSVELSVLTAAEVDADQVLFERGEQAAWHYYNFPVGLASWEPATELGRQMGEAYSADDEGDEDARAEAFLRACALALASPEVTAALGSLQRHPTFRISVAHPDSGRQFWPPG